MKNKLKLWSTVAIFAGAIFVGLTLIEDFIVQPLILAAVDFFRFAPWFVNASLLFALCVFGLYIVPNRSKKVPMFKD